MRRRLESRRTSRAYLASRVFLPMDFGYSVGIVLASLCASAVGDSARGICCSGDSWDMARDAIVTFRGCDEGFRRTRGGHEKRAPGWGPRRFADTPLESGDAREAKACATEARGTRRPTRVGVCGSARASSAAPSCHERFFWRIGFGAFSCTAGQSRRKLAIRRRSMMKTTWRRCWCRRRRVRRTLPGTSPHLVNARRRASGPAPLLEPEDVTMTRGRA